MENTFENGGKKCHVVGNESQQQNEITVNTPKDSGTLLTEEKVFDSKVGSGRIPMYHSQNGDYYLVSGPISCRDDSNNPRATDRIYVRTAYEEVGNTYTEDGVTFIFRRNDAHHDDPIELTFPNQTGYLLSSNSIIDCGEINFVGNEPSITYENLGESAKPLN
jgi:hypothetical protein